MEQKKFLKSTTTTKYVTCKLVVAHVTSLSLALVSQKISRHLFILSFCVVGSFFSSSLC